MNTYVIMFFIIEGKMFFIEIFIYFNCLSNNISVLSDGTSDLSSDEEFIIQTLLIRLRNNRLGHWSPKFNSQSYSKWCTDYCYWTKFSAIISWSGRGSRGKRRQVSLGGYLSRLSQLMYKVFEPLSEYEAED